MTTFHPVLSDSGESLVMGRSLIPCLIISNILTKNKKIIFNPGILIFITKILMVTYCRCRGMFQTAMALTMSTNNCVWYKCLLYIITHGKYQNIKLTSFVQSGSKKEKIAQKFGHPLNPFLSPFLWFGHLMWLFLKTLLYLKLFWYIENEFGSRNEFLEINNLSCFVNPVDFIFAWNTVKVSHCLSWIIHELCHLLK